MSVQNHEQIAFWNGARAATWVADQELLDRALAPFGEVALARAAAQPGESVVDVGCGCGASTLALADAVGSSGRVLGIDVSEPMLARAAERAAGRRTIQLMRADAATYPFVAEASLLHSRFGVMFFEDPVAAFQQLARALVPGGRMAFVCWRTLVENPWLAVPFGVARRLVPSAAAPSPDAPGPLAFGDADRVRAILGRAGFSRVEISPFDHPMPFGDGRGVAGIVEDALTRGPIVRLLQDVDDATRESVRRSLAEELAPQIVDGTLVMGAGAWVVSARVN